MEVYTWRGLERLVRPHRVRVVVFWLLALTPDRSLSLMWKKCTLIGTSLGTEVAKSDSLALLCILSIIMSLGDTFGIMICMSSFAYLGKSAGRWILESLAI